MLVNRKSNKSVKKMESHSMFSSIKSHQNPKEKPDMFKLESRTMVEFKNKKKLLVKRLSEKVISNTVMTNMSFVNSKNTVMQKLKQLNSGTMNAVTKTLVHSILSLKQIKLTMENGLNKIMITLL